MKLKLQFILTIIVLTALFSENTLAQLFWDKACSFNGTNASYFSVKNSSSLDITGSFTIDFWINPVNSTTPANQNIFQKRNTGSTGYAVLLSNGKISIRTNNTVRVTGNAVLPNNTWTHVAARYNSSNGNFSVYINGALDASFTAAAADPVSNTDSLWIGKGSNNPFSGLMDNIRIWNSTLTPTEISNRYRALIASNSGKYSDLVLSLPFQPDNSSGGDFTLNDMTSHDQLTVNRGVTEYDLSNRPSVTTVYNECIYLDGDDDYLQGILNINNSSPAEITMESWINLESTGSAQWIMDHGNADNPYMLGIDAFNGGYIIQAVINSANLTSDIIADANLLGKWIHLAFTYSAITARHEFYVNGNSVKSGVSNLGNVMLSDNMLRAGINFNGYIDELRVTFKAKSPEEINDFLFQSVDDSNDLSGADEFVYNFDGYLTNSAGTGSELSFKNNASFINYTPQSYKPASPLIRSEEFQEGFYIQKSFLSIESGISDAITSADFYINENETISDINVFIALNHTDEDNLTIKLFSPENESCILFDQSSLAPEADNIISIFDDQADSSLAHINTFVSISPKIKPLNILNNDFNGSKTKGIWRMEISNSAGGSGMLYAWGMQFNNHTEKKKILNANLFVQGFYNTLTNSTITDTILCNLRNIFPPYNIVAASKGLMQSEGDISFDFTNTAANAGVNYYLQLNHRNSVETWSSGYRSFNAFDFQSEVYDFTLDSSTAFGNNVMRVDNSPERKYAVFSGDVNQDGNVNLADVLDVFNSANSFSTGYVVTDVTGNNAVDLTDLTLAYNNSINFVRILRP